MEIKCKKLIIENFYPNKTPLKVLGKVINESSTHFTFKTGRCKEYLINKSSTYNLVDTDILYHEGVTGAKKT